MLVRRLVEHGLDRDRLIQRHRPVRKQLRPELHRGVVHRRPRRFQIGFRPAEDLLFREIGIEREPQLLAEFVVSEAEVAVGARQEILLQPLLVLRECLERRRLRRPELLLQRRRLLHQRFELLFDEIRRPLVLLDGRLRVHPGRVLQIRLRRCDDRRNSVQASDDRPQPLLRRRELAGDQRVDRAADVVIERVPLPVAQRLQPVDLRLEPVLQDAVIDRVLGGQLLRIDARQLRQPTSGGRQIALHSLRAVIVEPRVVAVISEAGRRFRIAIDQLLHVLLCEGLESDVVGSGGSGEQEDAGEKVHGGAL